MNYNHLFYFWNIAKEGSIKSASHKLNLSQPTLSDQLKTLEESIGDKLFNRTSRKLILNERGKQVFKYANKMFKISDELNEALLNKESKNYRKMTIGFVPSIAKGRIYEILLPFLNHDEFIMKVIEGEYDFINKAFEMDELDMIVCENPAYHLGEEYLLFKLEESTFYIVCAPKYKGALEEFPKSLSEIPFLNYTSRSSIQHQIFEYFYSQSIRLKIIGEVDDVNIIRIFTQNGHCFSILPKSVIVDSIKEGKLIVLSKLDDIKIAVHAIIRNTPKNKIIKKILEGIT
jgi:LysR family transcriptional regulator, transcriptional activator of nhaA